MTGVAHAGPPGTAPSSCRAGSSGWAATSSTRRRRRSGRSVVRRPLGGRAPGDQRGSSGGSSRPPGTSRSPNGRPDPQDFPGADPADLVPGSLVFRRPPAGAAGRLDPLVALGPGGATGGTRRGRARPCTAGSCTRSCTSASRTPSPTPPGPAAGCPPRPSGSTPPAAASTRRPTPGATSPSRGGRVMANRWYGRFPWENLRPHGFERTSPVKRFPRQRLRPVRRDRQRVGVDRRRRGRPPAHATTEPAHHGCCAPRRASTSPSTPAG